MSAQCDRRDFLGLGSAAVAGLAATMIRPSHLFASANKTVRLGFIGVGGRGIGHVARTLKRDDVEVPAICDIDTDNLNRALTVVEKARGKKPEGYSKGEQDFQRMVVRDDLDGVIISTPWRWHGPMAIATMEAGKYAGVETPGLITLQECWDVVSTWEKTGAP